MQLRIQNQNDADISLNGIRFEIERNDREFGNGISGQTVTVPRFGSETVNVEVVEAETRDAGLVVGVIEGSMGLSQRSVGIAYWGTKIEKQEPWPATLLQEILPPIFSINCLATARP